MRLKTKFMLCAAGVYSYLLFKETLEIDKRHKELDDYEQEVNRKMNMISNGIDIESAVDVDYDEVP